jgi:hypothetical protein
MNNTRHKGLPVAIQVVGNYVNIWVASPDGDESDSQILEIRCTSSTQAEEVSKMWTQMVEAAKDI